MLYNELDDKTIISILKKALLDKNVGDDLLSIASMAIELFENSDDSRIKMARQMARPIVAKYINLEEQNINREGISNESFRMIAANYIIEIRDALNNRILVDDVASSIAIILEDLTKEGASIEELRVAIFEYETCFRPAVQLAPINTSLKKKNSKGRK